MVGVLRAFAEILPLINHIIDLRDYPGGDLIHLLAIRKKEMSSYRTVIRQSGLEPKRSCGTQDPVRESFPMAKYTMSAVDRGRIKRVLPDGRYEVVLGDDLEKPGIKISPKISDRHQYEEREPVIIGYLFDNTQFAYLHSSLRDYPWFFE